MQYFESRLYITSSDISRKFPLILAVNCSNLQEADPQLTVNSVIIRIMYLSQSYANIFNIYLIVLSLLSRKMLFLIFLYHLCVQPGLSKIGNDRLTETRITGLFQLTETETKNSFFQYFKTETDTFNIQKPKQKNTVHFNGF